MPAATPRTFPGLPGISGSLQHLSILQTNMQLAAAGGTAGPGSCGHHGCSWTSGGLRACAAASAGHATRCTPPPHPVLAPRTPTASTRILCLPLAGLGPMQLKPFVTHSAGCRGPSGDRLHLLVLSQQLRTLPLLTAQQGSTPSLQIPNSCGVCPTHAPQTCDTGTRNMDPHCITAHS